MQLRNNLLIYASVHLYALGWFKKTWIYLNKKGAGFTVFRSHNHKAYNHWLYYNKIGSQLSISTGITGIYFCVPFAALLMGSFYLFSNVFRHFFL